MGHKGEYNSLELIPLLDKSNQLNSENPEVRSKNETVSLKLIPLAKCLEQRLQPPIFSSEILSKI